MDPLYNELLKHQFDDSASAVEFCRSLAFNAGFTVKQEASANRVSLLSIMPFFSIQGQFASFDIRVCALMLVI
jgi:hypothetical protein